MRPIVIIKETNKDDKFELTEKELRELIEQAYEQGFADGRPKVTLPQSQYDRPEDGILYRNISGGTASDPKDNRATLKAEYNDLVYRGWEHNYKFPKEGEPIPCWLNQTSGQPNPTTKLKNTVVSTGV